MLCSSQDYETLVGLVCFPENLLYISVVDTGPKRAHRNVSASASVEYWVVGRSFSQQFMYWQLAIISHQNNTLRVSRSVPSNKTDEQAIWGGPRVEMNDWSRLDLFISAKSSVQIVIEMLSS